MAKFYVGQPVVCVKPSEWWGNRIQPSARPKQGGRYTVNRVGTGYRHDNDAMEGEPFDAVGILELPHELAYDENAFAPITENQVQAIIAMVTDLPEDAELEDA